VLRESCREPDSTPDRPIQMSLPPTRPLNAGLPTGLRRSLVCSILGSRRCVEFRSVNPTPQLRGLVAVRGRAVAVLARGRRSGGPVTVAAAVSSGFAPSATSLRESLKEVGAEDPPVSETALGGSSRP